MGQLISFKYNCSIAYEKFSILIAIVVIFSVISFSIDNNHFNNYKTLISKYSNSNQHFLIVLLLPLLQKMYLKLSGSLALKTCLPFLLYHSFYVLTFQFRLFDYMVYTIIFLLHILSNLCFLFSPTCLGQREVFVAFVFGYKI